MARQGDLFGDPAPATAPLVPGLLLVEDAVTPEHERQLIAHIDAAPLAPFQFGPWQGKRMTCHYGSGYDFARGTLAEAPPLPDWLLDLRQRLARQVGRAPDAFGQALVIRYDKGAGIGWHRDRPQYAEVIGLSLGAPAPLRLRRRRPDGFDRHTPLLPPRSLYLLSGEVRHAWQHSLAPVEATRWSVTFRSLR